MTRAELNVYIPCAGDVFVRRRQTLEVRTVRSYDPVLQRLHCVDIVGKSDPRMVCPTLLQFRKWARGAALSQHTEVAA